LTEQLFSEELEVKGIFFLPPDRKIVIDKNGRLETSATSYYHETHFPEEYSSEAYAKLLYQARDELIQNMTAIFRHEEFEYIRMDLTDGLDTRLVLAAALNLPKEWQKKNRLLTYDNKSEPHDLQTACGLANMLNLQWDDIPRCRSLWKQTDGIDQSRLSIELGTYYPIYNHAPDTRRIQLKHTLALKGSNGETNTGLARMLDGLMYNDKSVQGFLGKTINHPLTTKDSVAKNNYLQFLGKELEKSGSESGVITADFFYNQFRNRLHFKGKHSLVEYGAPAFSPIQSLSAYKAKKMSFTRRVSFAFQFDLMRLLSPLVVDFPYLDKKQIKCRQFVYDNALLYDMTAKLESAGAFEPDYSRVKYDEARMSRKEIFLPDKMEYDKQLTEIQDKIELHRWLNTEEALLSCLKTIIDNVAGFELIGGELFEFILNQDDQRYAIAPPTIKVVKNKLFSLCHQILITR
jgi:hypothetical protein